MSKIVFWICSYICVILSSEAMQNPRYEILNKFQAYALYDSAACANEQQLLDLKKDLEGLKSAESIIQRMILSIDLAISCEKEGKKKSVTNTVDHRRQMRALWNSNDFKEYARGIFWERPLTYAEQMRKLFRIYWDYAYDKKPYNKDELLKIQQLIKDCNLLHGENDDISNIHQNMLVQIEKAMQDENTQPMKNYLEYIRALNRYNNMAYGAPSYEEEPFTEEVLKDIQEKMKLCLFYDTTLAVEAINKAISTNSKNPMTLCGALPNDERYFIGLCYAVPYDIEW